MISKISLSIQGFAEAFDRISFIEASEIKMIGEIFCSQSSHEFFGEHCESEWVNFEEASTLE